MTQNDFPASTPSGALSTWASFRANINRLAILELLKSLPGEVLVQRRETLQDRGMPSVYSLVPWTVDQGLPCVLKNQSAIPVETPDSLLLKEIAFPYPRELAAKISTQLDSVLAKSNSRLAIDFGSAPIEELPKLLNTWFKAKDANP